MREIGTAKDGGAIVVLTEHDRVEREALEKHAGALEAATEELREAVKAATGRRVPGGRNGVPVIEAATEALRELGTGVSPRAKARAEGKGARGGPRKGGGLSRREMAVKILREAGGGPMRYQDVEARLAAMGAGSKSKEPMKAFGVMVATCPELANAGQYRVRLAEVPRAAPSGPVSKRERLGMLKAAAERVERKRAARCAL